ncbi:AraC family transcriptional regulator [Paraburkholderia edwinii]|uniref:AraC family transcriptional regulator n=1 Tax=Paraburkholderia edwinii TaxID=2861782 RepID=A0ABX8UJH6_9BURK|nr:AraC family transcriptional regulator [Paraburkholderia edwinii]QYD69004.1 AraC family transcriptional regulator [Paraburkholderia edwinii]
MTLAMEEFYRSNGVELARVRAGAHASFPLHTHAEYVVSANLSGCESICLDGKELSATEGMVTVYNPEAMQSSSFDSGAGDAEFISLYIDCAALVGIGHDNGWLSRSSPPQLTQGVFSCPSLHQHILAAYQAMRDNGNVEFEAAMIELAAALLLSDGHVSDAGAGRSALSARELGPALEYMKSHLSAPATLDALSAVASVNKYQLIRSFKAAMGMTPARYHMQLRLIEARSRLRRGFSVQDVAFELGFFDQSHFINAFKKVLGVSPLRFAEPERFIKPANRE